MDKHLVFIASGGRTGTNFFGDQLRECIDNCWSEHEPDMFAGISDLTADRIRRFGLRHMIVDRAMGKTGLRILGTKYMLSMMSLEDAAQQLRSERQRYHEELSQDLVIESYCRWWMFADRINDIFPASKTVGVVRDPRSWIASWQSHHPRMGYVPFSAPFPARPADPGKNGRCKERCALGGDGSGRAACMALECHQFQSLPMRQRATPQIKLYRFEDLFGGDEAVLRDLLSFVSTFEDRQYDVKSVAPLHTPKKNSSKAESDDWTRWSEEEKALINEICGATMERCGYEPLPVRSLAA